MRFNKQKMLSGVLATGLALSCMVGPAFAAGTSLKDAIKDAQTQVEASLAYSDVKQGDWYYDAVMNMTKMGLFSGTGDGKFSPNNTMTRGEFLTVVVRYLYGDELSAMGAVPQGAHWADNARVVALNHGIINNNEIAEGSLSKQITRQEMTMIMVRASDANGETKPRQIEASKITDYNSIGTYYRSYVIDAISRGMIAGTSSNAETHTLTFSPNGVLTRGQAATVLYRLVSPENRGEVDYTTPIVNPSDPEQGQGQTWVEGEKHNKPQAGDTVIKADGTKVVLKYVEVAPGSNFYVLGYGQGVDIITGTTINGVTATEDNLMGAWSGFQPAGDLTAFVKDPITGEVHTEYEWGQIRLYNTPDYEGTYEGEKSGLYFVWDTVMEDWSWTGPTRAGY